MNTPLSTLNCPPTANGINVLSGCPNAGPNFASNLLRIRQGQMHEAKASWLKALTESRQDSLRRDDWASADFVAQMIEARERPGGMAPAALAAALEGIHQRVRELIRTGALKSATSLSRAACYLASPAWSGAGSLPSGTQALKVPATGFSVETPGLGSFCPDEVTLAAWIKVTNRDRLWHRLLESGGHPNGGWPPAAVPTSNGAGEAMGFSGNPKPVRSAGRRNNDHWHHVAVTFDGAQVRCYLDGVEKKTVATFFSPFAESPGQAVSERAAEEANTAVDDGVGEVLVYHRVLSAADIMALAGMPQFGREPVQPPRATKTSTPSATTRVRALKSLYRPDFLARAVCVRKLKEIMEML